MPTSNHISSLFKPRIKKFIPSSFTLDSWESLKQYYQNLLDRKIESLDDLRKWMLDRSELESFIEEDLGWRYINMTCDTQNLDYKEKYQFFINEIQPHILPMTNELDKKLFYSGYSKLLNDKADKILLKKIETNIAIFSQENIALFTEMNLKQQIYAQTCGAMTVTLNGKEYTLQQASLKLQSTDRHEREKVYFELNNRRLQDKKKLDNLLTELIQIRHKIALNAGFDNYRDFMFSYLHRFDYTPDDCFKFHEAVKKHVVPFLIERAELRKQKLNLSVLRPWDLSVDPDLLPPLKPFTNGEDLLNKTIACFYKINSLYGSMLEEMKKMNRFDLESRKGKAPGGYNYPLEESGVPFIFMNAAGSLQDMITLLHEGGHAIHSILTRDLPINAYRNLPAEIAELASMTMELVSIKYWDIFFTNSIDLKRAIITHLEQAVQTLPWVATIDKFQHWIYTNPEHSVEERNKKWIEIYDEFALPNIDWSGLENFKENIWQKQLHIFEVPFYYIEYGIAQLGAFAVWKNSEENYEKSIEKYTQALKLGYTVPISEVYQTAGIQFNFTSRYIEEILNFVREKFSQFDYKL